jgi:hypothetical protein
MDMNLDRLHLVFFVLTVVASAYAYTARNNALAWKDISMERRSEIERCVAVTELATTLGFERKSQYEGLVAMLLPPKDSVR